MNVGRERCLLFLWSSYAPSKMTERGSNGERQILPRNQRHCLSPSQKWERRRRDWAKAADLPSSRGLWEVAGKNCLKLNPIRRSLKLYTVFILGEYLVNKGHFPLEMFLWPIDGSNDILKWGEETPWPSNSSMAENIGDNKIIVSDLKEYSRGLMIWSWRLDSGKELQSILTTPSHSLTPSLILGPSSAFRSTTTANRNRPHSD